MKDLIGRSTQNRTHEHKIDNNFQQIKYMNPNKGAQVNSELFLKKNVTKEAKLGKLRTLLN